MGALQIFALHLQIIHGSYRKISIFQFPVMFRRKTLSNENELIAQIHSKYLDRILVLTN